MRTNFEINQLDADGDTGVMEISVTPAGKDGKKIALQSTMRDITLNKQVEEELRIMSSAIASSISPIAIANLEGNLTYVNHAFLKMWGYDNDSEVLEKPAVEFWYTTDEAIDVMKELKERGSWAGELVARRKDNSALDVQLSASLAIDERGKSIYMMASFIDITERKQAGEALRDSERRYRLLAENASDAIWTVDMNMKPTYMSPSINLLLGYSVEEAMMKRMEEVFTPASYELAMKTLVQELARENDKGQETTRS